LIGWADHARKVMRELGIPPRSLPYRATDAGFLYLQRSRGRLVKIRLTNFTARIVRAVALDDGVEVTYLFDVEARLDGLTVGPSGEGKSEIVSRIQQHHGPALDARHLPASWSSTPAANEMVAFLVKDGVAAIDDYVPAGGAHDRTRLDRDADRLLRAQGNRKGRDRLGADATLRPQRPPRGSC
jgi:hypothetical protein